MKRIIALVLVLILAVSLCACGKKSGSTGENAVSDVVVDGQEKSVKDYLIEKLTEYIHSDAYLAREAEFETMFAAKARPFTVTDAFELQTDDWSQDVSLHFFILKASCSYVVDNGGFDAIAMAIDYDTGMIYDKFNVDESWMNKSEKEQAIFIAAEGGCHTNSDYNGEPIFVDSEIHTPLSQSDIDEINAALSR